MAGARQGFVPKDMGWWRRERVVALGQEHGTIGPAVLDWLTCEARLQTMELRGSTGVVKTGYAAIAHGVFGSVEDVKAVITTCVEIGAIDDFEESGRTFMCRISGWHEDVVKPGEAARKRAEYHSKKTGENQGDSGRKTTVLPESPETSATGTGTETTSSLRSDAARRRAAKPATIDPDSLPENLPERLIPVVDVVYARLSRLAERKAAKPVTRHRVGDLVADHPDHDHQRIAAEFEDYWTHGGGAGSSMRDVPLTYRNRLAKLPATPTAALGTAAAHLAVVPDLNEADRMLAKWNRGNTTEGGAA